MTDELDLLDWKRRVLDLYAAVRAAAEPEEAWQRWRVGRDELFKTHPQSPLTPDAREAFAGLVYFPYAPDLRVLAEIEPVEPEIREIAGSAGSVTRFRRFARADFDGGSLELYWLEGYGGGVYLPFADTTSGRETYGGGRYVLDTVKGADLGMRERRLVLDSNFAYNPSCAYDPRWACPLSPPANRLGIEVRAGERMLGE
jgi:uncharacterized protein